MLLLVVPGVLLGANPFGSRPIDDKMIVVLGSAEVWRAHLLWWWAVTVLAVVAVLLRRRWPLLGTLDVAVDDIDAGCASHEISHSGQWLRFGAPRIRAGEHRLRLTYSRGWFLRAGRGTSAVRPPLGPIIVTAPEDDGELPVIEVPPKRARLLCDGRCFDWMEALA